MDLFVYGTLRCRALMAAVAGPGPLDAVQATLPDHAVFRVAGNVVPFIAPLAGATATGLIWQGLTKAQMTRLDAYEGAFGYGFGPVTVTTNEGPKTAQAYLPPDDMDAGVGIWSLSDWEAVHLQPAVLAAQELFILSPLPDHATLRAMWPMIESRAWAKHRAIAMPASRRYRPGSDDFQVTSRRPPAGQFFRFERTEVRHKRFDGTFTDPLNREGFVGVDAAIVLPYDAVRDRVLLVEQARLGPALRHDPNPWMLEPVAGIVDARETPQAAARRETREEAGLDVKDLIAAGEFYVSPGSSSDYFYLFVAICDLPMTVTYLGGLDHEAEDLRLHPMTFEQALDLSDKGEIQTGPAQFLLHWLLRHRDRLQAQFADGIT